MAAALTPHRWTAEEFHALAQAEVLVGRQVELLEGVVAEMTPQGAAHWEMVRALTAVLAPVAAQARLGVQGPVEAGPWSVPEPDLSILPAPGVSPHPPRAELAVEVVVTARDEARVKRRVYARAGVPVAWFVDVPGRSVEVLSEPSGERYARARTARGDDVLEVPGFGVRTTVAALFARAGRG
jgi:Uma2 family endonuclease